MKLFIPCNPDPGMYMRNQNEVPLPCILPGQNNPEIVATGNKRKFLSSPCRGIHGQQGIPAIKNEMNPGDDPRYSPIRKKFFFQGTTDRAPPRCRQAEKFSTGAYIFIGIAFCRVVHPPTNRAFVFLKHTVHQYLMKGCKWS